MGVYDVPAGMLIEEVAKEFREKKELKEPEFTVYVKTGRQAERAPQRRDWWYVRSASLLYRIYKSGPVGTERLRTYYGGKKNRGVKPHRFFKAGGKIIRTCLQELEKNGYIKKEKKGRVVTGKGERFLVQKSKVVQKQFEEKLKKEHERRFGGIKIVEKEKPVEKVEGAVEKRGGKLEAKAPEKKPGKEEKAEKKEEQEVNGEKEAVEKGAAKIEAAKETKKAGKEERTGKVEEKTKKSEKKK